MPRDVHLAKEKKRESENEIERFLALGPIIVSSNQPSEITGMASVISLAIECEQSLFCSKERKPTEASVDATNSAGMGRRAKRDSETFFRSSSDVCVTCLN